MSETYCVELSVVKALEGRLNHLTLNTVVKIAAPCESAVCSRDRSFDRAESPAQVSTNLGRPGLHRSLERQACHPGPHGKRACRFRGRRKLCWRCGEWVV